MCQPWPDSTGGGTPLPHGALLGVYFLAMDAEEEEEKEEEG